MGAVFLAVKLGIDNPKSGISFFRMCQKFLVVIEGLLAYDGYKYPASAMINFLLFVRLCRFKTREEGLEFLERYKGESINSFVAKMREKRNILDAICLSH
jgi:hypothetical protein